MITLVIPFHGDAERLPSTVAKLVAGLGHYPVDEVLFCHNGPGAPSGEVEGLITGPHPRFRLVHTDAKGIGAGYRLGLQLSKSPFTLLSASDLPFGLSDLENALASGKVVGGGSTFIFASKLHPLSRVRRVSVIRTVFSWGFYCLRLILFGRSVPRDCQGTLLVPTEAARSLLPSIPDDDYLFSFKVSALAPRGGYGLLEVPVEFFEDVGLNSDVRPVGTGLVFLRKVLAFWWEGSRKGST